MKKISFLVISTLVFFIQDCKDSTTEPSTNSALIVLRGIIENYTLSGRISLRMELDYRLTSSGKVDSIIVLDSTQVQPDGSFSMLLNNPPDILLKQHNGLGCAGLIFSNDSIRTYSQSLFRLYEANQAIGSIYCSEKPYTNNYYVGEYFMYLMFSEDELSVTGNCGGGYHNDRMNLNLVKGWNVIVQRITEYTDTSLTTESVVDNSFKGNWIYQAYSN